MYRCYVIVLGYFLRFSLLLVFSAMLIPCQLIPVVPLLLLLLLCVSGGVMLILFRDASSSIISPRYMVNSKSLIAYHWDSPMLCPCFSIFLFAFWPGSVYYVVLFEYALSLVCVFPFYTASPITSFGIPRQMISDTPISSMLGSWVKRFRYSSSSYRTYC